MSRHIRIDIPEPCSQSWSNMQPIDRLHRHCSSCDRIITDFTAFTDAEISAYLRDNALPCGRFRSDQLNKAYAVPAQRNVKKQKRGWLLAVSLLLTEITHAQSSGAAVVQVAPAAVSTITGRVVDAVTGEGLPAAYVGLPDGSSSVPCDSRGYFILKTTKPAHELKVYCLGYAHQKFAVSAASPVIRLQPEAATLSAVEIVSTPAHLSIRDYNGITIIQNDGIVGTSDKVYMDKPTFMQRLRYRVNHLFKKHKPDA